MWAPGGGWRAEPTSYAGVCVNYSMTPRQSKYVNDYASTYISDYRPNVFVKPISDVYANIPAEYKTEKQEVHTHWQSPRVPPYHRGPAVYNTTTGRNYTKASGVLNIPTGATMISARSDSTSSTASSVRRAQSADPHYRESPHRIFKDSPSRQLPPALRRKIMRHEDRLRRENRPPGKIVPLTYDGPENTSHPVPLRRTQSAKPPNWRVLSSEQLANRADQGWMVKTRYDPYWKPLPNYSAAWSAPGLSFLPRSIDTMPTGTDWMSAHCRTRQERALLKQGW
ncbi:unnamed protein product [Amoebophrya sp. A25]|nr:unnamed protein product [Amoebophrya sp. A25]|eukprot:GSA25T00009790001.1